MHLKSKQFVTGGILKPACNFLQNLVNINIAFYHFQVDNLNLSRKAVSTVEDFCFEAIMSFIEDLNGNTDVMTQTNNNSKILT